MNSKVRYQLPDGRIVAISYDISRARSFVDYTLANGQVVVAVIVKGEK
jgi:hypothetical protein